MPVYPHCCSSSCVHSLSGVLRWWWHMQWVKLHCDTTLGTLIHSFYNTPRGVSMLVYPHWCSSSCPRCLSRVLRWCWHMQWVKLHYDNTLGTLIHSFYNTPRGVSMLVYPHWCSSSCPRCLSRVLRWCWHMQWVKLHYDNTLGTLIHIFYHTPRGVWMLVYHTAAAVHLYAAFLGF
jgi:hypothetical protein